LFTFCGWRTQRRLFGMWCKPRMGRKKGFLTIAMSLIVVMFDLPPNVLLDATLVLAMNKNKHLYESF